MKERRERTMGDFTTEAAAFPGPLDYTIRARFNAERHPERSVDGDDRDDYSGSCACGQPGCDRCDPEMDLYDIPDDELPGMWERADFMGGQD